MGGRAKIERLHDFWQKRLPSVFAAEDITTPGPANVLLDELRVHLREKRSALRPAPACPWWPYVWSQRSNARVDPDGRVALGTARLRIERPPGSIVIRCLHPNGDLSVIAAPPTKHSMPVLLIQSPAPAPVLL